MDVVVVGAGIIGCSAAAFLAEAGADVVVHDRSAIAAGASGRNSGVIQHPIHGPLAALFAAALGLHREVLDLADEPDGILMLGATSLEGLPAEVAPELVADAAQVEPAVRPGIPAVRANTGWVVGPEAVTRAWAARAQAAGARFALGGDRPRADLTLVATGAWTDGITPLYGVTARVDVRSGHVLEEAGTHDAVDGAGGELFTLVGDVLGSSASRDEPDPGAVASRLAERARPYVGDVAIRDTRFCPRPLSPDGLPLVGRTAERTYVCAGHGAWGISVGPATAKLVADIIRGVAEAPPELDPARLTTPIAPESG